VEFEDGVVEVLVGGGRGFGVVGIAGVDEVRLEHDVEAGGLVRGEMEVGGADRERAPLGRAAPRAARTLVASHCETR
jgi:hypothetical protein